MKETKSHYPLHDIAHSGTGRQMREAWRKYQTFSMYNDDNLTPVFVSLLGKNYATLKATLQIREDLHLYRWQNKLPITWTISNHNFTGTSILLNHYKENEEERKKDLLTFQYYKHNTFFECALLESDGGESSLKIIDLFISYGALATPNAFLSPLAFLLKHNPNLETALHLLGQGAQAQDTHYSLDNTSTSSDKKLQKICSAITVATNAMIECKSTIGQKTKEFVREAATKYHKTILTRFKNHLKKVGMDYSYSKLITAIEGKGLSELLPLETIAEAKSLIVKSKDLLISTACSAIYQQGDIYTPLSIIEIFKKTLRWLEK